LKAVVCALARFVRRDDGQDLIEYAFIVAFVALAALLAVSRTGSGVNDAYGNIRHSMQDAAPHPPDDGDGIAIRSGFSATTEPCRASSQDGTDCASPGK
jgi:Flp pilus assembly pilin Flp